MIFLILSRRNSIIPPPPIFYDTHTHTHPLESPFYTNTYSMEQSPSWEANRFSASQEIPRILWNPKVHYRIYNCLPPVLILSQTDPVLPSHPTSRRSILIIFSHLCLGLPNGLFPSGFLTKTLYTPLLSPICATCPDHPILLDMITWTTIFKQQIKSHLPFEGIIRSSPYSPRFQDKG